jgi:hypothetical protein
MLKQSIELPGNTTRRIAIDKKSGEFVIFDETLNGEFHGHVRDWKSLDNSMQGLLRKLKLVDKKGRMK